MARRLSEIFSHAGDITVSEAIQHCGNFLGGSWSNLKEDEFSLSVLQGGMVNRIFICENKSLIEDVDATIPRKVILRLYGGKLIDASSVFRNGGITEEVLVFYTMARLGYGPKLYGVFEGGRLEQYIPSHTLNNADSLNSDLEASFARQLARMHVIDLPLNKRSRGVFGKIDDMLPGYIEHWRQELIDLETANEQQQASKVKASELDVEKETAWIYEIWPKIKTRRVLCHGDMNRANCLVVDDPVDDPDDRIVLIDYEFASYGNRGSDIGLHFRNRQMDVTNFKNKFQSGLEYPTIEERVHFIEAYNREMVKLNAYELDLSDDGVDNVTNILMEADFFILASNLFFVLMMLKDRKKFGEQPGGFSQLFNIFDLVADIAVKHEERKKDFMVTYASKL